ncbi:MAG: helix-turn-helix domain-containing protein [Saprospiraceae bacterium]|nr:helix-turn-helix domain-containing protein [Saprospiraceae bacterium]
MLSIINILQLLIISQSLLFAGALWRLGGERQISNRLLAAFHLLLAFQMLLHLLRDKGLLPSPLWNLRAIVFAYGPVLFLYVDSLIQQRQQYSNKTWLHFIPVGIIALGLFTIPEFESWVGILLYITIIPYILISYGRLSRWEKAEVKRAGTFQVKVNWLRWAIGIFSMIIFFDLISFAINQWFPGSVADIHSDYLVLGLVMLFVNIMVFKSLLQPSVLSPLKTEDLYDLEQQEISRIQIYQTHQQTIDKLQRLMAEEKPFLNPQLNVQDLADQLGIPARQLSEIVNQYFEQNFAEYVNSYRLSEAEKRFQQSQDPKETILEVMYSVGFNSKSSFNTLFKERTGLTPSAYKKQYRIPS